MIQITILYFLHCFTAFILMFADDEANLKTDDMPNLTMPTISDIDTKNIKSWELQSYVDNVIIPSTLYFSLLNDIKKLQSDCCNFFWSGFFIQLFSIVALSQAFVKLSFVSTWSVALLISVGLCSVSCFILNKIYKKGKYKINHFSFTMHDDYTDIDIIKIHYRYLCTIKHTVWFRYCLRKILSAVSFTIYLIFFFTVPSYYQ